MNNEQQKVFTVELGCSGEWVIYSCGASKFKAIAVARNLASQAYIGNLRVKENGKVIWDNKDTVF